MARSGDPVLQGIVDQLRIAEDDRQEVVEVMGDAAGELADRFHLLRVAQLLLGGLALAGVADRPDENPAAAEVELADAEVDRKHRAVAAQALQLAHAADDPRFAGGEVVRQLRTVSVAVLFWHQPCDVGADQLRFGEAERAFDRRIGAFDRAVLVDADDAVDGIVEDRAQARLLLAALDRVGEHVGDRLHEIDLAYRRRRPPGPSRRSGCRRAAPLLRSRSSSR